MPWLAAGFELVAVAAATLVMIGTVLSDRNASLANSITKSDHEAVQVTAALLKDCPAAVFPVEFAITYSSKRQVD